MRLWLRFWRWISELGTDRVPQGLPQKQLTLLNRVNLAGMGAMLASEAMAVLRQDVMDYTVRVPLMLTGAVSIFLLDARGWALAGKFAFCFMLVAFWTFFPVVTHHIHEGNYFQAHYAAFFCFPLPYLLFSIRREVGWIIACSVFYLLILLFIDRLIIWAAPRPLDLGIVDKYYSYYKFPPLLCWVFTTLAAYYQARIGLAYENKSTHLQKSLESEIQEVAAQNEEITMQNESLAERQEEIEAQQVQIIAQRDLINTINRRLMAYTHTLMQLTKSRYIQHGDWADALQEITRTTSQALGVSRVSIWEYEPENPRTDVRDAYICCLNLYEAAFGTHTRGLKLISCDFPAYFRALEEEELVVAHDAYTHPATAEFKSSYLQPLNIFSLLDAPYWVDGRLAGVICLEQQEYGRIWTNEDIYFLKSIGDLITIAWKAQRRRLDTDLIFRQREEITLQNLRLVKQQKQIMRDNQTLETKVKERTVELEMQNRLMAEYAFINAHLLRAPLARVMGLVTLLRILTQPHEILQVITYMEQATQELDEVVHNINQVLESKEYFQTEDLRDLRDRIRRPFHPQRFSPLTPEGGILL
jgi:hypothetical protein